MTLFSTDEIIMHPHFMTIEQFMDCNIYQFQVWYVKYGRESLLYILDGDVTVQK